MLNGDFQYCYQLCQSTDCKNVVFIMNEVNEIEEEMDMWTKEFMKYFTVKKVKAMKRLLNL